MPKRALATSHTHATATFMYATFGEALKFLRKRARQTQDEFGRAVGYSREQIARLENGSRLPDLAVVAALFAPALGIADDPATLAHLLQLAGQARDDDPEITITRTVSKRVQITEVIESNSQPFDKLRTQPQVSNLPAPVFPLIGREENVQAACDLLRNDARLLSLVGPPGVGKTRLALHVAQVLAQHFADGAHFISLAPISDATALPLAIANALGLELAADQSPEAALRAHLAERNLLLVLDNFEHVLASAQVVADCLAAAPGLRVLVTSRAALDLYGEHVFDVAPLPLPDLSSLPPFEDLVRIPAVQLFTSRARAAASQFRLNEKHALPIAAICVALDGLPLALEIAAARIRELDPQTLLQQLVAARSQHQLSSTLLAQTKRDVAARHRTLQDAIAWSFNLLSPDQQNLFATLGVFVGGFDEAALQEIRDWRLEIDSAQSLISNLQSLLNNNLIQVHAGRYTLLETLRAFALDQLVAHNELDETLTRHAQYFLRLAENVDKRDYLAHKAAWRQTLAREYNNLVAALGWAIESRSVEMALRLAVALNNYWEKYGNLSEGLRELQRALALVDDTTRGSEPHAQALLAVGVLAYRQSHYAQAEASLQTALSIFQTLGQAAGAARALNNLGNVALDQGQHTAAQAFYEASLTLRREQADSFGIASTLNNLGDLAQRAGNYAHAQTIYLESLAGYRQINDIWSMASVLTSLGNTALALNNFEAAQSYFDESLALRQSIGDDGRYLSRGMANLALRTGDYAAAIQHFQRSLRLSWQAQELSHVLVCIQGLAVAVGFAQANRVAAHLLGAADALSTQFNITLDAAQSQQHDDVRRHLHDALGAHDFASAYDEGRALSLEQTVNKMLGE